MIYRIKVIKGRKYATAVKSREEFMALRNSSENLANLEKARQGDDTAKKNLEQFAYKQADRPCITCLSRTSTKAIWIRKHNG